MKNNPLPAKKKNPSAIDRSIVLLPSLSSRLVSPRLLRSSPIFRSSSFFLSFNSLQFDTSPHLTRGALAFAVVVVCRGCLALLERAHRSCLRNCLLLPSLLLYDIPWQHYPASYCGDGAGERFANNLGEKKKIGGQRKSVLCLISGQRRRICSTGPIVDFVVPEIARHPNPNLDDRSSQTE